MSQALGINNFLHHFDISTLNALNQAPCGQLHMSECKWKQFHMWLKMQPLRKVFSASVGFTSATSLPRRYLPLVPM